MVRIMIKGYILTHFGYQSDVWDLLVEEVTFDVKELIEAADLVKVECPYVDAFIKSHPGLIYIGTEVDMNAGLLLRFGEICDVKEVKV
jgi:hypothetical protein